VRALGRRVSRDLRGQLGRTFEQPQEGLLHCVFERPTRPDEGASVAEQHLLMPLDELRDRLPLAAPQGCEQRTVR
jgi:hypothetical protein